MSADPMFIGSGAGSKALDVFLGLLEEMKRPTPLGQLQLSRVLELGTLQSEPGRSTHHAAWLPDWVDHVKSDVEPGPDVDVVADAHDLLHSFIMQDVETPFDVAIAVSVWEHLELPWVCARELRSVLRGGAPAYVGTHHAFPVHGYPSDYTRWTDDGLAALFEWAGFEVVAKSYAYPCIITPPREVTVWNPDAPAYLNVDVCVVAR